MTRADLAVGVNLWTAVKPDPEVGNCSGPRLERRLLPRLRHGRRLEQKLLAWCKCDPVQALPAWDGEVEMRLRACAGRGGRAGRGAGLRREQAAGGVTAGGPSRRGGQGQQAARRGRADQGMAATRGGGGRRWGRASSQRRDLDQLFLSPPVSLAVRALCVRARAPLGGV